MNKDAFSQDQPSSDWREQNHWHQCLWTG
jgi:hypothetical protein